MQTQSFVKLLWTVNETFNHTTHAISGHSDKVTIREQRVLFTKYKVSLELKYYPYCSFEHSPHKQGDLHTSVKIRPHFPSWTRLLFHTKPTVIYILILRIHIAVLQFNH